MTCTQIECLVARHYNIRQHIIVPNVSWGLGLHECDVLVVSKSGYATEVEIKISKADLKKDASKKHAHASQKIKYLYFAIPEKLKPFIDLIPAHAGIFIVTEVPKGAHHPNSFGFYLSTLREAQPTPHCRPLTEEEINKVARLGTMRIWGLKNTVQCLLNDAKHLRAKIKELENLKK